MVPRLQEASRGFKEASKRLQEAPRGFKMHPRGIQEASIGLLEASRGIQEASKRLPEASRGFQRLPRGLQEQIHCVLQGGEPAASGNSGDDTTASDGTRQNAEHGGNLLVDEEAEKETGAHHSLPAAADAAR